MLSPPGASRLIELPPEVLNAEIAELRRQLERSERARARLRIDRLRLWTAGAAIGISLASVAWGVGLGVFAVNQRGEIERLVQSERYDREVQIGLLRDEIADGRAVIARDVWTVCEPKKRSRAD